MIIRRIPLIMFFSI